MSKAKVLDGTLQIPGVDFTFTAPATWAVIPDADEIQSTGWQIFFGDGDNFWAGYTDEFDLTALSVAERTAFFTNFKTTMGREPVQANIIAARLEIIHEVSTVPFPVPTTANECASAMLNGFQTSAATTNMQIDLQHMLYRKYNFYLNNTTIPVGAWNPVASNTMAGTSVYAGDKLYYRTIVHSKDDVGYINAARILVQPTICQYTGASIEEKELPYIMNMLRSMDVNTDA